MSPNVAAGLAGAHERLLPETIPLRFFGTAIIAQGLAWAGVAIAADEVPFYQGGPGSVAAAVHTLTLGVLVCTAMGASLQILPVALGRPAPGSRLSNAAYGLLLAGAVGLIVGFAGSAVWLAVVGRHGDADRGRDLRHRAGRGRCGRIWHDLDPASGRGRARVSRPCRDRRRRARHR
jgi:hypothetical protein